MPLGMRRTSTDGVWQCADHGADVFDGGTATTADDLAPLDPTATLSSKNSRLHCMSTRRLRVRHDRPAPTLEQNFASRSHRIDGAVHDTHNLGFERH
jgi:hypothetical protein